MRRDLLSHFRSALVAPGWRSYLALGADRQGTGMLRRCPEDTRPTNAAVLTESIHDHQMRDPRSADAGSLGKELHQQGGVHR